VDQALRTVGLPPEGFARRKWYELSGGEARRVALASRIVFRPRVLILDEPTANIDRYSSSLIKEAITLIRSRYGTTLIVASHDLVWLQGVVDTTLELHDGHLVEYNRDNLLRGPWVNAGDGLWKKLLPDGQVIFAANPPHHGDAVAVLNPSHVIVSTAGPVGLSARNLLKGKITLMTVEKEPGKVRIEIDVSGLPLVSSVTQQAVKALGLVPGKTAWAVFKVSSLKWY
jgi:tungstate transport system ATP-binding protein